MSQKESKQDVLNACTEFINGLISLWNQANPTEIITKEEIFNKLELNNLAPEPPQLLGDV